MVSPSIPPKWRYVDLCAACLLLLFGDALAEPPTDPAGSKSGGVATTVGTQPVAREEFTPWMSLSELNAYMERLEDGQPPGGRNFWDRGNRIDEVEGRWEAGIPQYRVSHSAVPEARAHWWFWYVNQDRQSFDRLVGELADEGCVLVQFNSYGRPGGSERFQGVWHKLIPLTHAPLLPAGHYRLSEMRGKPLTEPLASLVIDGDRISGHGPTKEFKGSVRDRFSGVITATPPGGSMPRDLTIPRNSTAEYEFLKLLEYGTWSEKNGKLRVTKDGQTVLRFEQEQPEDATAPPKP